MLQKVISALDSVSAEKGGVVSKSLLSSAEPLLVLK